MAFDFPASPTLDQTYTAHGVTFRWNSYAWVQVAAATGVTDGDKGDITVSGSGGTWTIDPATVTNAKLAAAATSTIKGRITAGSGDPEDLTPTQAKTVLSLENVNNTSDANKPISTATQTALNLKADLASPTFTGDPKAPTPTTADNDTSIATTAFVKAQGYVTGGPYQAQDGDLTALAALAGTNVIYYRSAADTWSAVTISTGLSFSGGALTCTVSTSGLAPLASPVFTGDPQAPTPATADNDTSIATTAFVKAQGYATTASLSSYAPLASPALSGNPTAPTPGAGDNDTSIATTAFVQGELAAKAPIASPTFTGDPKAPTPSAGDNDTSIATTAFVRGELNALKAVAYVADTAPAGAVDGALWYESDSGLLYIRYNDGSTTQWVAIAARAEASP
jgi:hypothetical protein